MPMLEGKTVMLVEDEAILAIELQYGLEDSGARIEGPFMSVSDAVARAKDRALCAAILDVDLGGESVFPVADVLAARGIPFVFHTGRSDCAQIAKRYDVPICTKPIPAETVIAKLRALFDRSSATQG